MLCGQWDRILNKRTDSLASLFKLVFSEKVKFELRSKWSEEMVIWTPGKSISAKKRERSLHSQTELGKSNWQSKTKVIGSHWIREGIIRTEDRVSQEADFVSHRSWHSGFILIDVGPTLSYHSLQTLYRVNFIPIYRRSAWGLKRA